MKPNQVKVIQCIAAIGLLGAGLSIGKAIPKEQEYQIEIDGNTAYVVKACEAPVNVFRKAEQELNLNYKIVTATPITDKNCGTVAMRYVMKKHID